jgi:iron complex transport system substrate-binding protein
MRKDVHPGQAVVLVILLLLLFPKMLSESALPSNLVVDHAERLVELPADVHKVYATTEMGTFVIYALDPDAILGWNRGLSPELEFAVLPAYHALPTLGTWDETYQTMRTAEIIRLAPDLILHYAPVNARNRELAEEVQKKLGIPAVLVDSSLASLPDALRLLGSVLGKEVRGQVLAAYVENHLAELASFQELHSAFEPIPVHIVSPREPGHFDELLGLAGMVEMPVWNDQPPFPDLVLIMPDTIADPYRAIEKDGHKRIYQIPSFPLNWLEPGSIFSLLGLEWLHSIAYPTAYRGDLVQTYSAFMEVFFQLDLTPELLAWTLRRSGIDY